MIRPILPALTAGITAAALAPLGPIIALAGVTVVTAATLHLLRPRPPNQPLTEAILGLGTGEYDSVRAHTAANTRVGKALVVAADTAARRQAEQGQRLMLIEQVLDTAPLAIVVCDDARAVVLANGTAQDLFHAGRDLIGSDFDQVLARCPPDMRAVVESQADRLFTVTDTQGGDPEAYLVSRPHFAVEARRYTVYMVKQLTRELSRQEVAIWKKMIRVVSHELNNSLAPVSSLLHSARLVAGNPEHAHRLGGIFDTIDERITHLNTFLQGYARFARLAPPEPKPVHWPTFVTDLRALFEFQLDGPVPEATAQLDPAQLQQALINLFKNARESGSPLGDIQLRVTSKAGGTCLAILDRGKGMPEAVRGQAMLPFYSTKKRGTGLGLALVREIAEAHGGTVHIDAREGGGTAVRLWLPAEMT